MERERTAIDPIADIRLPDYRCLVPELLVPVRIHFSGWETEVTAFSSLFMLSLSLFHSLSTPYEQSPLVVKTRLLGSSRHVNHCLMTLQKSHVPAKGRQVAWVVRALCAMLPPVLMLAVNPRPYPFPLIVVPRRSPLIRSETSSWLCPHRPLQETSPDIPRSPSISFGLYLLH